MCLLKPVRSLPLIFFYIIVLLGSQKSIAEDIYLGVIYPEQDLFLSFGVSGLVVGDPVRAGARVKKGQPLVFLDTKRQRVELEHKRLSWEDDTEKNTITQRLDILQQQLDSSERLYQQSRSISLDELNKLRIEVLALEGRLEQIKIEKEKSRLELKLVEEDILNHQINSPIDGVVIQAKVNAGEWAKQGDAIIRLVDVKTAFIKVNVPDNKARGLKEGQNATINVEGLNRQVQGRIDFILPIADAASGLVEVKISLLNQDSSIRPGSKAQVSF